MAATPQPPYYVVIFTSSLADTEGYAEMAELMEELARKQDGFLGIESARDGIGITLSYWRDLDAIRQWKAHTAHQLAQQKGREQWYQSYTVRIAKVERAYGFEK